MNKKTICGLQVILITAAAYLITGLPFHMTGLFGKDILAGLSSCTLFLGGLLFGWKGMAGGLLGFLAGCVFSVSFRFLVLLEAVWLAVIPYILWYGAENAQQACLRTGRECMKFAVIAAVTSLGNGIIGALGGGRFWFTSGFTFIWCIVGGMPMMILLTSILGVESQCLPRFRKPNDMEITISAKAEEVGIVNDQIEELGMLCGLERKRMFRVMLCMEELLIRIIENGQVKDSIQIAVKSEETIRILVTYQGKKYNPLRMGRKELQEELLGLKLVMQMSLRASYSYILGENEILIVI